jgi:hypothetical protein
MQITKQQVVRLFNAIVAINESSGKTPVRFAYAMARNRQRIAQEIASIHAAQSVALTPGEGDDADGRRLEFEALLAESVEFDPYRIRLDDCPTDIEIWAMDALVECGIVDDGRDTDPPTD